MLKGSSKKIWKNELIGKVYNFLYELVREHHYLLFTKMCISTFFTKLCTTIMDILPIYGRMVFK
jgi:hypothetical protein